VASPDDALSFGANKSEDSLAVSNVLSFRVLPIRNARVDEWEGQLLVHVLPVGVAGARFGGADLFLG